VLILDGKVTLVVMIGVAFALMAKQGILMKAITEKFL
jgi:hypothetical protein